MTARSAPTFIRDNARYESPRIFDFLGIKKGHPLVPTPPQVAALQAIKVPWPGIGVDKQPYPRIFALNFGRRAGKTTIGEALLWLGITADEDDFGPPTVRLTADTEEHGMKVWRKFIWHLENTPLAALVDDYSREYQLVTLKTGATAQLLSAHNPNTLSGDGVTLWLIDEAQFLSQEAWENLYPSTSDRNGVIVMMGVSEGEGPFKEVCYRGDEEDGKRRDAAYQRLVFPSAAYPFISKYAIEEARRILPPQKFKQLYLAEWVGELGKIFRNVEGCVDPEMRIVKTELGWGECEAPKPGHGYFGGLDLARLQDYTVYTVWDRAGRLVAFDRFNLIGWEQQKARIVSLSRRYHHPVTVVDSTGIGDPVFDDLVRLGMSVEEYKISSNEKKRVLVDELAVRIGAGQVKYPRLGVLINELNRMEAKKAGENSLTVRYEAPAGGHDDCVLSAALAMQVVPRFPSYGDPLPALEEPADQMPWHFL